MTAAATLALGWREEVQDDGATVYVNDATNESTLDRCANPDCGTPFVARTDRQRTCSKRCSRIVDKARHRVGKPVPRPCAYDKCEGRARGDVFQPRNVRHVYCSKRCHDRALEAYSVPGRRPCPICGEEYQPTNRANRAACPKPECKRTATARRFSNWYVSHKAAHQTNVVSARKRRERRTLAVIVVDSLTRHPEQTQADLAKRLGYREDTIAATLDLLRPALDFTGDVVRLVPGVRISPLIAVPKRGRPRKDAGPGGHPSSPALASPEPAAQFAPDGDRTPATPASHDHATPDAVAQAGDAWHLAAPDYGTHLPGGAFEIRLVTHRRTMDGVVDRVERFGLDDARTVHGCVSVALNQGHDAGAPDFALLPTSLARSCWGLYVADDDIAARLALSGTMVDVRGQAGTLRVGPRVRLRSPVVAQGPHRVRLDTVSPVVIKQNGRAGQTYRAPTAESIVSALLTVAKRVGLTVEPASDVLTLRRRTGTLAAEDLRVEVVEHETETMEVDLTKLGGVTGWNGWVVLDVNAPARWLLEVAARVGLGSRVAFGFGRVFVADAGAVEQAETYYPPVTSRERYEEHYLLLTPVQRDVLAIFAEAQRRIPHPTPRGLGESTLFVTPHAVQRYRERVEGTESYEEALSACIDLARRGRRVGPAAPDENTGEPREEWAADLPGGRRVTFIVGYRPRPELGAGTLPQMVTVLPLSAEQAVSGEAAAAPVRESWVLTDRAAGDLAQIDGCTLGEARRRLFVAVQGARFVCRARHLETWEGAGRQFMAADLGEGIGEVRAVRAWE